MKFKKVLIIFSIVLLVLSTIIFAAESDVMPINIVEDEQTVYDNDWFYCSEKIDLAEETIEGNIFLIAKEVILTDVNIMGSAFIITENLQLDGFNATGSLYTISQKMATKRVSLSNIYTISENIVLDQETEMYKSLYALASSFEYNARTTKDVNVIGENITIGENANVLGSLNITSNQEPSIPETASISEYNFILEDSQDDVQIENSENMIKNSVIEVLNYVLGTVVIAFVILKLFPTLNEKINSYKVSDLVINSIIGLGLVIATPIVIILLIATGILSKIGFVILWVYVLAFVIASPIAALIIGLMIAKKLNKQEFKYKMGIIAIVAIVVSVLKLISGISTITAIVMGIIGFGSILKLPLVKKTN